MTMQQQPEVQSGMLKFEDILKDTTFSYLYGFCNAKESFQTLEVVEQDIYDPRQWNACDRIHQKKFVESTSIIKMTGICRINPIPVYVNETTPHNVPIPTGAKIDKWQDGVRIYSIRGSNLFAMFRGIVKVEESNCIHYDRHMTDFKPDGYWGKTGRGVNNNGVTGVYELGFDGQERLYEKEKREWFEKQPSTAIKEIVREKLVCDSCVNFH